MLTKPEEAQQLVRVSGRGTLVNFQVDDTVPVAAACDALQSHLCASRELYARGDVALDVGRRILDDDQVAAIRQTVELASGLTVKRFLCDPEILERERQRITELLASQSDPARKARLFDPAGNDTPAEGATAGSESCEQVPALVPVGGLGTGGERYGVPALVVRGTCRAGEVVRYAGNLVILGNVNPGAQVIADGDILIFGGLRGLAHAGAAGDATATVLAMSLVNPMLRIAGYVLSDDATPPPARRPGKDGSGAIIARVTNGAIRFAPYQKNFTINHGGNPNER